MSEAMQEYLGLVDTMAYAVHPNKRGFISTTTPQTTSSKILPPQGERVVAT